MKQRSRWAVGREKLITLGCRSLGRLFDLFQGKPPQLADLPANAHLLILKPCCLGDVVLTTPAIVALREALPQARLDYAVSGWARPVVENNLWLNATLDTGSKGSHFSFKSYLAFIWRLRKFHYQGIIVFDRSPLLNLIPWLAGAKIRAGLDSAGRGFALNVRAILIPSPSPTSNPSRPNHNHPNQPNHLGDMSLKHEAEIYLEVLKALGIAVSQSSVNFFPTAPARAQVQHKAAELGLDFYHPFAVIHPGGGNNPDTHVLSKRWPSPNFARIAEKLTQQGYQVVVIGAPDRGDRELADELLQAFSGDSSRIFDAVGCFDIGESGALFEKAALFVGNDTGLMHLAAACSTAVVAVFGPSNPLSYGPYTSRGRAVAPLETSALGGLPLSEYQRLSAEQGGIQTVSVERVWQACQEVLSFEF